MAKRLWTTSALAVVVMMLVGACAASTTSPSPAASAAASAPAAERAGRGERGLRRAQRPRRQRRRPAVPAVPTGYTELDQALGADKPFTGKTVSIQTQWIGGEGTNFAAAVADFATATGITDPGRQHRLEPRDRAADAHRGRPAAGPGDARPADGRPGLRRRRQGHRRRDVHGCRTKLSDEHPATIGLVTQGGEHLGHPVQGRRQVDHLVPDQGLRGQGLRGSQRRGTS